MRSLTYTDTDRSKDQELPWVTGTVRIDSGTAHFGSARKSDTIVENEA